MSDVQRNSRVGATPPYHQHNGWIPGGERRSAILPGAGGDQDEDNKKIKKIPIAPQRTRVVFSPKPKKKNDVKNSRNSYYSPTKKRQIIIYQFVFHTHRGVVLGGFGAINSRFFHNPTHIITTNLLELSGDRKGIRTMHGRTPLRNRPTDQPTHKQKELSCRQRFCWKSYVRRGKYN